MIAVAMADPSGPFGLSEQGVVAIAVALIGGPLVAWITTRGAKRKAAEALGAAEEVKTSVGVKNGHGTVQEQGAATAETLSQILDELGAVRDTQHEMRQTQHAMQTSLDSVVGAAAVVGQRLKAHDREIAALKRPEEE